MVGPSVGSAPIMGHYLHTFSYEVLGKRSRRTPRRDRAARACASNPGSSFKIDTLYDTGGYLLTLFQLPFHSSVPP
ncbi:hypothetical protein Y032_0055g2608 [Ancylostoma ceylanicum]|uniref:Uncharacterized protein n=1 Tax=Ancylostoma ceylanicum TaxID=53326 RepID=A0A016U5Y9_9BILA|nr:hypothetical protein Y032_0055g2608 [Ancylostoma ceylanicum]